MREFARLIMQHAIRDIESDDRDQTVSSFDFDGQSYRRNRLTSNTVDTRFGSILFDRWYFQNTQAQSPGIPPLDVRLGIVARRMTPALAEVTGRLAASIFGTGKEAAHAWAAQQKRRHSLKGIKKDFTPALNYLKKYRPHLDYAERKAAGDPIGSGITEAGYKVIFNQRLKQSGMRWHCNTGQFIVDPRTANRSGIWRRIWRRLISSSNELPPITQRIPIESNLNEMKTAATKPTAPPATYCRFRRLRPDCLIWCSYDIS